MTLASVKARLASRRAARKEEAARRRGYRAEEALEDGTLDDFTERDVENIWRELGADGE